MKISAKVLSVLLMVLLYCMPTQAAEQVLFYHTDPAGTPLSMTNSSGTVVWRADYKPFGEEQSVTATAPNDKRFVGKEKDEETGLSYFGARYENARIGRFIAPDPVRAVDQWTSNTNEKLLLNPQRLNTYAYALNNPYRYMDPDGREPISEFGNRMVNSETFKRIGETIGASQLNAAITGYDFRGNEYSGFGRIEQFGIALATAPVSGNSVANAEQRAAIEQINPKNLLSTQSRSEMSGSQINRLTKDMKVNGYDQTKPIEATRNTSGRLEIQDGHHRTQSAINAGINKIPVRIRE